MYACQIYYVVIAKNLVCLDHCSKAIGSSNDAKGVSQMEEINVDLCVFVHCHVESLLNAVVLKGLEVFGRNPFPIHTSVNGQCTWEGLLLGLFRGSVIGAGIIELNSHLWSLTI